VTDESMDGEGPREVTHAGYSKHSSLAAREARARGDIATLLTLLVSPERGARISAVLQLGELGGAEARDALLKCLNAGDDKLRNGALVSLRKIGDPSTAQKVLEIAESDPSPGTRLRAIEALMDFRDPKSVDLLVAMLEHPGGWEPWYRRWAVKQLSRVRAVQAIPALERAGRSAGWLDRMRIRRLIRHLRRHAQT
jgi:HEAT repeat protein